MFDVVWRKVIILVTRILKIKDLLIIYIYKEGDIYNIYKEEGKKEKRKTGRIYIYKEGEAMISETNKNF